MNDQERVIIRSLKGDLREVAEIIGVAEAFRLVEKYGGAYIYIPARKVLEGDLKSVAEIVGEEKAFMLVDRAARNRLSIPRRTSALRVLRNRAMREEYDSGDFTTRELVQRYGVCLRTVQNVLQGSDEEETPMPSEETLSLFS